MDTFRRSSQQVKNVTLFFVFFMTLYAIFGIQLFGRMDYHCVQPSELFKKKKKLLRLEIEYGT